MDYSVLVRRRYSFRQLQPQPQKLFFQQRACHQLFIESYAADVFHDEAIASVLPLEIVNRGYVGVIEFAKKLRLATEPIPSALIAKRIRREDLDGHFTPQVQVLGVKHVAHASTGDFPHDSIPPGGLLGCILDGGDEPVTA